MTFFLNELGVMHRPKVYTYELSREERRTAEDLPKRNSTDGHRYTETRVDGCIELAAYIEKNTVAGKSFLLWRMLVGLIEQQKKNNRPGIVYIFLLQAELRKIHVSDGQTITEHKMAC